MTRRPEDPVEDLLPLKPREFSILLALADEELYGYGIVKRIAEREGGSVRIAPGNLYQVLDRMIEGGLIRESGRRPPAGGDTRRRYYAITPLGRRVAAAEADRLRTVLSTAERLALLQGGGG